MIFRAGPTWESGPPEEQPGWQEHADFVDALIENGTFVMGGPFSDYSGSVNLLEGLTAAEAKELIATDPFVLNGVFVVDSIREGNVQLVINTTQGAKAIADSYSIRRNALLANIPYFTTIAAGLAAVDALEVSALLRGAAQVRSIQEWHSRANA